MLVWVFIGFAVFAFIAAVAGCIIEKSGRSALFFAPFILGALLAAYAGHNLDQFSISLSKSEYHNVGAPQTIIQVSITHIPDNWDDSDYDVAFVVSKKLYHAVFGDAISINPSLKAAQATIQYQANQDGGSRYIVTSVQEPLPKK